MRRIKVLLIGFGVIATLVPWGYWWIAKRLPYGFLRGAQMENFSREGEKTTQTYRHPGTPEDIAPRITEELGVAPIWGEDRMFGARMSAAFPETRGQRISIVMASYGTLIHIERQEEFLDRCRDLFCPKWSRGK